MTSKWRTVYLSYISAVLFVLVEGYSRMQTDHVKSEAGHNSIQYSASTDEICRSFVEGAPGKHEFYSPGWPSPYPNHTDCVLVLEAPKGYLLRLDFRDTFDLEPSSDCRFDFLEIRDGAHGYCDLLGQFCSKEFPPMITSSDRFLWLRFRSDENIEYAGFKAIYEFVPRSMLSNYTPELDTCRIQISGNEGMFGTEDIPKDRLDLVNSYNAPVDCMWVITVKDGWKVTLSFPEFKLERPNDCDNNFVDVFSDRTDLPSRQKNFCGSIADAVVSRSNVMFVRFFATSRARKSNFYAMYTAFREKKGDEICAEGEWDCEDTTCVSFELRCNGKTNCRFRSDEDNCVVTRSMAINSEHIVIIMIVFSFILSGMCITFFFHCFKKLIRDYRTIQEHMRTTYEHQLNIAIQSKDHFCHSQQNFHQLESQKFQGIFSEADSCYVPDNDSLPSLVQNHVVHSLSCEQAEMYDSASQTHDCGDSPRDISELPSPLPLITFGYTDRQVHEDIVEADYEDKIMWANNSMPNKTAPDVIVTH